MWFGIRCPEFFSGGSAGAPGSAGLGEARVGEFLVELVDATGRIHELHLAGEEPTRQVGNLQLDQRILVAVFPDDGFFRGSTRTAQPSLVAGKILENDRAIILRMDTFFHGAFLLF